MLAVWSVKLLLPNLLIFVTRNFLTTSGPSISGSKIKTYQSRTSTKFEFTYPGEKNAERTCAALRNCSKGGASGFALRDDQFSSKHTERFHGAQAKSPAKKQRNHRGESHILHAFREHDRLSVTRRDFQVNIARSVGSVGL